MVVFLFWLMHVGQGVYEILIFKGLFIKKGKCSGKYGGVKGGLSIKIWGTDGQILAGNVSGKLIAAAPVQVSPFSISCFHRIQI